MLIKSEFWVIFRTLAKVGIKFFILAILSQANFIENLATI
jgi:hypothetical protein